MTDTAPAMDNALRLSGLARKRVAGGWLAEDRAHHAIEEAPPQKNSFAAQLIDSKTVTVYACLDILNSEDRNISTAEHPDVIMVGEITVYKATGCAKCNDGYKGRVGIYQVMPISENMARLIMENRDALTPADQANKEGRADVGEAGLRKVKAGMTSLAGLNRVITV